MGCKESNQTNKQTRLVFFTEKMNAALCYPSLLKLKRKEEMLIYCSQRQCHVTSLKMQSSWHSIKEMMLLLLMLLKVDGIFKEVTLE